MIKGRRDGEMGRERDGGSKVGLVDGWSKDLQAWSVSHEAVGRDPGVTCLALPSSQSTITTG